MKINATVVSTRSAKPTYCFGQTASVPLQANAKTGLLLTPIPGDIPDDAIVTKAELVFHTKDALTGSRTVSAQRNATGFAVSKSMWNNRPAVTGTATPTTVNAVAAGSEFRIAVPSDVQGFISGALTNHGWRIFTSNAGVFDVYGAKASRNQPYLDLEYEVPSEVPMNLSPDGGAVSVANPTLTFSALDDMVSLQVQIDAAADAVSPDWDSGEVPATRGEMALSGTTHPGLALGAATSWRVRAKTALGWSAWSEWASFSRVAKPTVTISAPGPVTGDKTPPVTWTAPGQESWRVLIHNAVTGELLDDSRKKTSADTDWTPSRGLKRVGESARITVQVWDGVDRVQTPGDPVYAEATAETSLVSASTAPGPTAVVATTFEPSPAARIAWDGVTPDEWQVVRDDEWLDRVDGLLREFYDYTARPLVQHVYKVLPVSDGAVSPNSPTRTLTIRSAGAWLIDPETGDAIMIGDESVTFSMLDQAVMHDVIDAAPVRRRNGQPPPSGTVSGVMLDSFVTEDYVAEGMYATALAFKASPQGAVYRFVWRSLNIPVTIGDLEIGEIDTGRQVGYSVSLKWWQTNDEIAWRD